MTQRVPHHHEKSEITGNATRLEQEDYRFCRYTTNSEEIAASRILERRQTLFVDRVFSSIRLRLYHDLRRTMLLRYDIPPVQAGAALIPNRNGPTPDFAFDPEKSDPVTLNTRRLIQHNAARYAKRCPTERPFESATASVESLFGRPSCHRRCALMPHPTPQARHCVSPASERRRICVEKYRESTKPIGSRELRFRSPL